MDSDAMTRLENHMLCKHANVDAFLRMERCFWRWWLYGIVKVTLDGREQLIAGPGRKKLMQVRYEFEKRARGLKGWEELGI